MLTKPIKLQKPNKKESKKEQSESLYSEIPEWLQEFIENLVDDEIPECGDSHASSSHEPSLEPTLVRSVDLGKHSVFTHFPKDRNCEICQRTKITRAPCRRRNGEAVLRAENFGDLITADHKVLSDNCEFSQQSPDLQSWCRTWPPSGSSHIRAKQKTSQENQRSLQNFLEPDRKPKVIYTDNSLEFRKSCENLSWNHCTSTLHRSETNGIAERAVHRVKESILSIRSDENWWADSMEWCETYGTQLPSVVWRRSRAGQFLRLRWAGGGRMRRPSSCIYLRNPTQRMLLH